MIVECPGCRSRYDVTGRPPGTRARCRCGSVFELPEPQQSAGQLNCPSCGAGVPPTAHTCEYCTAELLVKACPRCFAKIFHGSKHCRECGAEVEVPATVNEDGTASTRQCPRCEGAHTLEGRLVGDVLMDECPACHGVWLDNAAVERIVKERRQPSAQGALNIGAPKKRTGRLPPQPPGTRMYVKCPDCEAVMNRVNFARSSGIIVDVCRAHGTWFDPDELPRVVEFIMEGGMEKAQQKQLRQEKDEARQAQVRARMANMEIERSAGFHATSTAERNAVSFGGVLGSIADALLD